MLPPGDLEAHTFEYAERLAANAPLSMEGAWLAIRATQERRYQGRCIAVDLRNPDFELFARAFGVDYWRAEDDGGLERALAEALASGRAGVVEVRPADSR